MKLTLKSEEEIPSNVLFPGDVVTLANLNKFYLVLDNTYFTKADSDKIFLFDLKSNYVTWMSATAKYIKVKSEIVVSFKKERT